MNTFSFQDIFKKGFLNLNNSNSLNSTEILTILAFTLLLGLFIFFVYKKTYQGVLYTKSFSLSLVILSLVTALIIMAVSANIILSLGMVGALSIIRFRAAIKDPLDIVFMFWAISVGIANGAGFFQISLFGSLVIALVLFALTLWPFSNRPFLLILTYPPELETEVESEIKKLPQHRLKSKVINESQMELTLELRIKTQDTNKINPLREIKGIKSVVLMEYDGKF